MDKNKNILVKFLFSSKNIKGSPWILRRIAPQNDTAINLCHPERSEGSHWILRHFVPQNDTAINLCHPERSEGSHLDSSGFTLRMTYFFIKVSVHPFQRVAGVDSVHEKILRRIAPQNDTCFCHSEWNEESL